jgi:hypothetical protein
MDLNITGEEWENICEICLQEKFKDENFNTVPATTQGDWGLDGYTRTGIIFQCYNPEERTTNHDLHKKLQNKINTDLKKIEEYQKDIKILMDGVKIKKWILLTYRIPNKAIHIYAKRKEDEYRNKQLEILDEDFIVSVQPFSFIQLQFSQMKLSKKLSYINGNITYDEELEKNLDSDYLGNLNRKLKYLFGNKEKQIQQLKQNYIVQYFRGMEVFKKLQEDLPKDCQKYMDLIATIELNLTEILSFTEKGKEKETFLKIKEDLENRIKENFSENYESQVLDKLRDYQISFWLLHCPLNFED